ncbi:uroporphyrinogen-III synthase [Robertmurraya kyonggiensis]|uniref:Uroporphyrinogen-III synthase n=1 Tax=Robertmurraya kyonggiensis TaxID=1037680 RepID=A0A4U1D0A5_9BACI|nr:uroporphyrinogen-III synthase [Robertmurraya kyonggiensis]TKC15642.1 uroporphyrinogen-III synthase [Robertmurraya kyonggiensis]
MSSATLRGKKVLVPRGKKNAKSFSTIVEELGGVPIEIPLLAFRPVENQKIPSLHTYDWLIFTSNVTVETFFSLVGTEDNIQLPKIAVIGEKTEQALLRRNVQVDFKPHEYVAESFVQEFSQFVKKGDKLLLPKGNLARDLIAQFFKDKGHIVDEMVIYETYFPEESKEKLVQLLKSKELDVLPFTSPSTIDHFMSVVRELDLLECIEDCIVAAIGPVSKRRCEEHGLTVHVMPENYTSFEMLKAVVAFLEIHKN